VFGVTMFASWDEIGGLLRIIDENDIQVAFEFGVRGGEFASFLVMKTLYERFWYFGISWILIRALTIKLGAALLRRPEKQLKTVSYTFY